MKKFQMICLGLSLILSSASWRAAHADAEANLSRDGAEFFSESKNIRAVMGGGPTIFTVFKQGQKLYESSPPDPQLKLGNLFVAEDGRHVAWMLKGAFVDSGMPANWDQFPALVFYQDGKILRSYSLGELLLRKNLVSQSTSHLHWIHFDKVLVAFKPDGSRMEFQTTSFRRYVFNALTGEMLTGEDVPLYTNADLILYGKVAQVNRPAQPPCSFEIGEAKAIKGALPAMPLAVSDDLCSRFYEKQWVAVILKKSGTQWKLAEPAERLTTIYNRLP